MGEPISISLPSQIDDFDQAIDTGWEFLRSSESINKVFYAASTAGDFSLIWHALNLARRVNNASRRGSVLQLALVLGAESLIVNQGILDQKQTMQDLMCLHEIQSKYCCESR